LSVVDRFLASSLPYIPKFIVERVSRPYIAGESIADATRAATGLNSHGFRATMDLLGEHVETLDQAQRARRVHSVALSTAPGSDAGTHPSPPQ